MEIKLGDEVMGKNTKLGEVSRLAIDPNRGYVDDLVVKRGLIGGVERFVPLGSIERIEGDTIYVSVEEKAFETMNQYSRQAYHAPDPDYTGPPPADQDGDYRGNMQGQIEMAAGGAQMPGTTDKPLGFPGNESVVPEDKRRPVISKGATIFAAGSEKVGELAEFGVDSETLLPTRVKIKRGLLGKEVDIPTEWVKELGDEAVTLKVSKTEIEALTK